MSNPFSRRTALRLGILTGAAPAVGALGTGGSPALAQQTIGYPTFTGGDPVPPEPAPFTVDGTFPAMFEAESDGTDFWMDRLLAREGADPAGDQWLMTRGRALLMRTHDPAVIGFGGQMAYYDRYFDRFNDSSGFSVTIGQSGFSESVGERRQTPSHWRSVHNGGNLTVEVQKFITHNNVAVANIKVTNNGSAATVPIRVASDFAWQASGDELTGVLEVRNSRGERLTSVFPRLSGTGLAPSGGALAGELQLAGGASATLKVQLGVVAEEIPESSAEYAVFRDAGPAAAFATHVRAYNRWWADNLPYFDFPDEAHKKFVYYRWWLMRYNYLDADIPGNDFQFPTSIEGVTGYNNAIALTVPMFVDDLKYLRDPVYSYGPWVSTGESSRGGRFMDNPGDPENWSNSYTQYIAEAAWRSYQIHGGQKPIVDNLARYAEGDVKGQLSTFDSDDNYLLEYDWGAMTGNDADAVSFHWRDGNLDRAESAYLYSGALAAAEAYALLGNGAKAAEMNDLANRIADGIVEVLWNPDTGLFEHVHVASGDHVPWKEINNYYPFSVGAVPNEAPYTDALRLFGDPEQYPVFPFYTANQADKAEAAQQGHPGSNNFSQINSTVQFRLFSSVIRDYDTDAITVEDYRKLLYWNAWATFIDGDTRWPDSNEFWANWNPATRRIDYRSWIHHTILGSSIWTYVEDVAGLRPRTDDKVELSPIDIGWDHFTVNHLRYRDADLTVVWSRPGGGPVYPGAPEGYSVFIDGTRVFTLDGLVPAVWDPDTGQVQLTGGQGNVLHSQAMPGLSAPQDVEHSGRVVDVFAKAGAVLEHDAANLALGAAVAASHTASGSSAAAAVNGTTINAPYWSSAGSGNASDWFEVDFGGTERVDEVRLYFYRDRTSGGLAAPTTYRIEYHDGDDWAIVLGQVKDPAVPRANYNRVKFNEVGTDRLRVVMTHRSGHATGLKEIQAFLTGDGGQTGPENIALAAAVSASHTSAWETTNAVNDGIDPPQSNDTQNDRWGTWPEEGEQWVRLDWNSAVTVSSADMYFFDDGGGVRVPSEWRIQYLDGGQWTDVNASGSYGTAPDQYHHVDFDAVTTTAMRAVLQSGAASVGILEWKVFTATDGEGGNLAPSATVAASHTSAWETTDAVNDGIDPPQSNDTQNDRWGTWPEEGEQWVQLTWNSAVTVSSADMYFFDDGGGVRVPASWRIEYLAGGSWQPVNASGSYGTAPDQYNSVDFDAVTTTALRAVLQSGAASVGVLEWKVLP